MEISIKHISLPRIGYQKNRSEEEKKILENAMMEKIKNTAAGRLVINVSKTGEYGRCEAGALSLCDEVGAVFDLREVNVNVSDNALFMMLFDDGSFLFMEDGEISDYDYDYDKKVSDLYDEKFCFQALFAFPEAVAAMTNGLRKKIGVPKIMKRDLPQNKEKYKYFPEPRIDNVEIEALRTFGLSMKKGGVSDEDFVKNVNNTLYGIGSALVEGVQDGFFVPEESRSWDDTQETEAQKLFEMVVRTDPYIKRLGAASDQDSYMQITHYARSENGYGTEITDHTGLSTREQMEICKRADEIMDQVLGTLEWTGQSYEYNDGAYGRKSGYSAESAIIAQIEIYGNLPSSHEIISETKTLVKTLMAKGMSEKEACDLVFSTE